MPFAPTLFHFSLLPPLAEAGISAAYMPHERISPRSGLEGRALHAAKQSVIEAGKKAVAAMTCPGAIPLKTACTGSGKVPYGISI